MKRRVFEYVAATPWFITEEWLRFVASVAYEGTDDDLKDLLQPRAAVQRFDGEPLAEDSAVTVRDGIGILTITGPLMKRGGFFRRSSGLADYESIGREAAAIRDAGLRATVLDIDSPGGEVHGVDEAGEALFDLRQAMPVISHVGGTGASAGYWLAAAAHVIVATELAFLGSIGARIMIRDARRALEKAGIDTYDIVSSQSPNKVIDPAKEEGRSALQALVDELAHQFIGTVARYRDTTPSAITEQYGQGGILVGRHALRAGLIDRLGSFESAFALADERSRSFQSGGPAPAGHLSLPTNMEDSMSSGTPAGTSETPDVATATADAAPAPEPAAPAAAADEPNPADDDEEEDEEMSEKSKEPPAAAVDVGKVRSEAVAAERARILAINDLVDPSQKELAAQLVQDGVEPGEAAMKILKDQKARRSAAGENFRAEAEAVKVEAAPSAAGDAGQAEDTAWNRAVAKARGLMKDDSNLSFEAALDKVFAADSKLQSEYLAEVK